MKTFSMFLVIYLCSVSVVVSLAFASVYEKKYDLYDDVLQIFVEVCTDYPDSDKCEAASSLGRIQVLIEMADGRETTVMCSAIVISYKYLLTPGYCVDLNQMIMITGKSISRIKRIGLMLGYTSDEDEAAAISVEFDVADAVLEADTELGYAIIGLTNDASLEIKRSRFRPANISGYVAKENDEVFVAQYPAGTSLKTSEACPVVALTIPENHIFGHACDTMPGSNGGAVFRTTDLSLIGMHTAGNGRPLTSFRGRRKHPNKAIDINAIAARSRLLSSMLSPDVNYANAAELCEGFGLRAVVIAETSMASALNPSMYACM